MRDLDVGYLGVVVDDRDPQAVFDQMVERVQARLPAWVPHNAALEVIILEAFAVAASDWIYATNRTVGAMVESVIALYGVPRDPGEPATGRLRLTFDGAVTVTIAEGDEFVTDEGVTLLAVRDTPTAGTEALIDVEEAVPGEADLLAAGAELSPVAGIQRLSTCVLVSPVAGGRPAEGDLEYITRAATRFRRVTSSLVLPTDFTAWALEDPRVARATTLNGYNGTTAGAGGHVTVVVYGRGAALPAEVLAELETAADAASASILTAHVIGATLRPINIDAGITVAPGYDPAETVARATDVLAEWLSWSSVGFGMTVGPDVVEAVLAYIPGVSGAVVTDPTGDVTCEPWELPAPGAINVHV